VIYCIDTSSLISAWSERYPIKNVPGFWGNLEGLINNGRIFSPEDVRREITKKSAGLFEWLDNHRAMFVELEVDIQTEARGILGQFPHLTKQLPGRNSADPFVIALAKARGYTVITEEGPGSLKRPSIPLVCVHFGIQCINNLGLIQSENWVI
jgi:hypothetical protein